LFSLGPKKFIDLQPSGLKSRYFQLIQFCCCLPHCFPPTFLLPLIFPSSPAQVCSTILFPHRCHPCIRHQVPVPGSRHHRGPFRQHVAVLRATDRRRVDSAGSTSASSVQPAGVAIDQRRGSSGGSSSLSSVQPASAATDPSAARRHRFFKLARSTRSQLPLFFTQACSVPILSLPQECQTMCGKPFSTRPPI
jgi:hypothetical protein